MTTLQPVEDRPRPYLDVDLFELIRRRRGWSDAYLREIESAGHDELLSLAEMVDALEDARAAGRKITIAPDFDMDGIASGVLGYAGLSELGFDVELHVPDYRRGHDVTPDDVAEIARRWPTTRVLLTCDGGVNSHRGIAAARALGWTTLVTDHHEELPPGSTADVTVDPCRLDETYANRAICGAHVLYQVIEAYARVHRPGKLWEVRLLRLFAGLGTVSDVMPLLYENRQLVRDSVSIARLLWVAPPMPHGAYGDSRPELIDIEKSTLMRLLRVDPHHPVYLRAFQGFALLLKAFTQAGKLRDLDDVDEGFYGFYLAPSMNSPRRTEDALEPCFTVFTAPDPDTMLDSAHQVIRVNERRKQLTADHLAALAETDQPLAPWVYLSDAPAGMYGLLANQLMEHNGHPVVVVNRPTGPGQYVSGSGRAPEWFDIISSLEPHAGLEAIGHQQACGVKVARAERLDALAAVLADATRAAMLTADQDAGRADLVLGPDVDCDAGLDDLQPLVELVRRTEALKPFGQGFTAPVVQIAVEPLGLRIDRIGADKQHLRLVTKAGLSCLWWNATGEKFDELRRLVDTASRTAIGTLRFIATLQLNTYRGDTRVQAVIVQQVLSPA
ncbi:DHH family phosphoesterase [Amycolatopsis sp. TNS106]|uniref:DHH family phosphoesterase n=1 Tax=Amycolatopsis sp. TNS106 TaxID=2861750 RepID=UPI001C57ED11|nr:DHH family phosphoesterase [Amycolatopsis sp. TNS106]QXV57416.1 phosphoesterase [Amycolatopsis sp. TNS106]